MSTLLFSPRSLGLLLLLALGAVLASAQARAPAHDAPATLKVMSFNVRVPVDSDGDKRWEIRRSAMAALIRAQHPDVFGTQELVKRQADYLAAQLHDYRWFGRSRDGSEDGERMGVFYDSRRLKLLNSGDFWLSDTPAMVGSISWGHPLPRMVNWGLFERIADGRRFYLFDTHLPYRDEDEAARAKGAALILSRLQALPADVPVVVTGDFNTAPDSPTYRTLVPALADARKQAPHAQGPEATFHDFTGHPDRRIDWILSRGLRATHFATLDARPQGHWPSDHFPVEAEFAWPQ
ncbi:endonuclease/exonuclease/phosphatase family protein [Xanthomonas translucens pv. undulosa]|uniref:endonuclease/exonuclease/phosphatase family protein n=1 Tax=Xanthomonas campestris pv. translucens TaxID=343 RepID=UPI00071E7DF4|nr:endonuclease/exonuclease/phosphatase family protein [Xanthomonas translucens]AVY65410.1 endonuclease [Xanthomonas translucens pv. undulosa]QEO25342.1 endonuclease/exonuclease/phosphatase family protein [Xanthomonas translucens pv. undulosa]QSQ41548.1 endonuclease/exonuclease/phosphatase family protein [Xanthomonas translucens pv. translucens]QSQ50579.1 endonuclease/exonuclease/phosphatase family protein [Xanthomonas translucens pv. undulosa]QSQ52971.1 endonuclease/exonuclease/phosphatase fa